MYSEGTFYRDFSVTKNWFHYWVLFLTLREMPKALPKELATPSLPRHRNEDHQMGKAAGGGSNKGRRMAHRRGPSVPMFRFRGDKRVCRILQGAGYSSTRLGS